MRTTKACFAIDLTRAEIWEKLIIEARIDVGRPMTMGTTRAIHLGNAATACTLCKARIRERFDPRGRRRKRIGQGGRRSVGRSVPRFFSRMQDMCRAVRF